MKTAGNKNPASESEYVVLDGVPWATYEGILDALGEYHLRHTYDEGALEMRRVVYGVAWEDYLKLLDATPDFSLRHTYDEGTLEMMSPRKEHDWVGKLAARMIEAFAFALDIPIQSIGSTTLRAAKGGRGLQPDEAYYLAHEPQVHCKETYEPEKDPPPDLVIEIDVTSSSIPRLPVFAKIGVPEIWRCQRGRLRFYRLSRGKYGLIRRSVAFPFLKPADLMRFLNRRGEIGENGVVREFVAWATRRAAK
ncbi:MAG: Uma2 family endonuclease [Thermoguttaceae bacterium]|jgi:Uma2 family endonuclease